ncbi:MAG: Unknown protein [uncultured Sulfurovum sp.]|uniref:Uncharacterized protein n=1 Tax=uncultured Sulfurovum sp. TaxID=269237 RepID=A0A6S6TQE4_9BACT|nr:MAG: Unknown protein [uncultured Sulfurovum sp.]
MLENVQLVFAIFGFVTVIFIIIELVLDVDTFAGRLISKIKQAKLDKRKED